MYDTPGRVDVTQVERPVVVAPDELVLYHRNPRRGDVDAIAASLRANDQYRPLTVNVGSLTGRPCEVLAGNHTLLAIRKLAKQHPDDPRWQGVQVFWVDQDDEACRRIVLADNRTAELGGFDTAELYALLEDMPPLELVDVGYSADDVADLRAALEEVTITDLRPEGLGVKDKSLEERASGYAEQGNRIIVLSCGIRQFVWAQQQLEAYRKQHDLDTNTDVLLGLLADWCGEPAPEVSVEV